MKKKEKQGIKAAGKIVVIDWIDSVSHRDGWGSVERVQELEPAKITSVGILTADRPGFVTIIQSLHWDADHCTENICIPKVAIKKMRMVGKTKEWK